MKKISCNIKHIMGFEKLNAKKLCLLGMLTAITVILAIYCTFRVGNSIKIPFKFITVFITGALFGPIWAGTVGLLGDVMNSVLFPVGPPLPQISAVEFLYGFIFGLFFYKKFANRNSFIIRAVICSFILTLIDIFLMSYILKSVGYFPNMTTAVSIRLPASLLKFAVYIIVTVFIRRYLSTFERHIK